MYAEREEERETSHFLGGIFSAVGPREFSTVGSDDVANCDVCFVWKFVLRWLNLTKNVLIFFSVFVLARVDLLNVN